MNRRSFLGTARRRPGRRDAASVGRLCRPAEGEDHPGAHLPAAGTLNLLFNQSNMVVTVETDIGITGIGDGGAKDTLEQCAGTLIGKNPFRIEAIWQEAYIAWFYPPGREKTHALGALDVALWDIKGKALGLPVHELLGGAVRDYCDCYATGGARPPGVAADAKLSMKERARATMEAGYRAFRMGAGDVPIGDVFDTRSIVRRIEQECRDAREGVGPDGNWCIDFHQRFDLGDAIRCCKAIEPYEPFFVEVPVRARARAHGPPQAAADDDGPPHARRGMGPEVGLQPAGREPRRGLHTVHPAERRRDHRDDEGGRPLRDPRRRHRPALRRGPSARRPRQLPVHVLRTGDDGVQLRRPPIDYLPECLDFKNGKAYTNQRPGLGVTPDMKLLTQIGEVTEPGRRYIFRRPDGSLTHW